MDLLKDDFDLKNMRVSLLNLNSKYERAIKKYSKYVDSTNIFTDLESLLTINSEQLFKVRGFGKQFVETLVEFKTILENEIDLILRKKIKYKNLESSLIVPIHIKVMPLKEVEKILLEDIDNFLDVISDDKCEIIQKRWGFTERRHTLEEIAMGLGVTRERIRQQERKLNIFFLNHMRINQNDLWKILELNLLPNIKDILENLYYCFTSEIDFFEFLGFLCGQESLIEYIKPNIERNILNNFFAANGAPVHINKLISYLEDADSINLKNASNAVYYLEQQGLLNINENLIWPRKLGKAEASACVLYNHEKGLPWRDIAQLVNKNKYSRTKVQEQRSESAAFELPEYIYLAGVGVYRHTRFIDIKSDCIDDIFIEIMEFAELNKKDTFHLNQCHSNSEFLSGFDYYSIRHFVRNFGEDYGIYFDGKSQSDSISFKKVFKRTTQKDVILEYMNKVKRGITTTEIANLLKSKSEGHANYYIDILMNEGSVVQVDRRVYTTPKVAYQGITINEYVEAIDLILRKYSKPVEPSIFQEEINFLLKQSYSKYFYASIARLYSNQKGWFRKSTNLYSKSEIKFDSLNHAVDQLCNIDKSLDENFMAINLHIAITREVASMAIANWKHSKR